MGHIYFKQFMFMQGNLNNNVVLMHIDVAINCERIIIVILYFQIRVIAIEKI